MGNILSTSLQRAYTTMSNSSTNREIPSTEKVEGFQPHQQCSDEGETKRDDSAAANDTLLDEKPTPDVCTTNDRTENKEMRLDSILSNIFPSTAATVEPPIVGEQHTWREIRLFLSSTFIDTQAERDVLVKRVIPSVNRKLASRFIRITPVDLRWGVLADESKDCHTIQKTCLNQLDKCRQTIDESPWFIGLRTERYGWVQNDLCPSEGFAQAERCRWMDKFREYEKHISITSLECIHACQISSTVKSVPTIFFYKRLIANPDEIEENLRWVFDFEYVTENTELESSIQYQYTRTDKATTYKEDKANLDKYLESLDHVTYSSYNCRYEKEGARFTCKNEGKKSFGVGYVSGLEEFEDQVEADLLKAVDGNFAIFESCNLQKHIYYNTQHEDAIKLKASTFVGRSELFQQCTQHCSSPDVDSSVLVMHGQPGCGKSALFAAVSKHCIDEHRSKGDFVFIHAVDSCPGSNILDTMLRRLQENLRYYRRRLGETDLPERPEDIADLKSEHLDFLRESASKFQEKMFIILVDAVNQFHENLQAWRMWWLIPQDAPKNIRVVISTLNEENGTFQHACSACPNAVKIEIGEMSYQDHQEMVTAALAVYRKKLTTSDDSFLGNQMERLLMKNKSPLYLISAVETIRKFGIFEQLTEYINKLPDSVSALFSFLLDEWSTEYGKHFTQIVTGLLCVSKDGLLENQINDILSYIETEEGVQYDCSFSLFYEALSSFLAFGGGGYLKFFHDLLKFEVKRKFLNMEFTEVLHRWLANFHLSCILPQLQECPHEYPVAYYEHCLQQVVYHQLETTRLTIETTDFTSTLRNIYFVRERVKQQQEESLHREYRTAIKTSTIHTEVDALKQWAMFAQLYSPYIKNFPEWAYNMAINQIPSSCVAIDTSKLPVPKVCDEYPVHWSNNNSYAKDAVALRFSKPAEPGFSCCASRREKNLCCIGGWQKAFLYEADSGVVLQQVKMKGVPVFAVYLSAKFNTFWTGNTDCSLSVWDADTGNQEWSETLSTDGMLIWISSVGEHVACGTGDKYEGKVVGTIAIIDEEKKEVIKRWSTELIAVCYCFHEKENLILSGHKGVINCWTLDGSLMKKIEVGIESIVMSLHASPKSDVIAFSFSSGGWKWTGGMDEEDWNCCITLLNVKSGVQIQTIRDTGALVLFDSTCEKIVTTGNKKEKNIVMVYGVDGHLQHKLKGHSHDIMDMCLIPGTHQLLTVTCHGSKLFNIPSTSDEAASDEGADEVVIWCDILTCGEEFATLNDDGELKVWEMSSCQVRIAVHIEGAREARVHPDGTHIVLYTEHELYWLNISTLDTVCDFKVDDYIRNISIAPDGCKCVVATKTQGAIVFDIACASEIKKQLAYSMDGMPWSSDVHRDNTRVVTGSTTWGPGDTGCMDMWNIITGETICKLRVGRTPYVKLLYDPERILYVDTFWHVHIMDFSGVHVISLNSQVHFYPPRTLPLTVLRNEAQLLTSEEDDSIRLHDLATGKVFYTFVNHRSQGFRCFLVHPLHNEVYAYNNDGNKYILQNTGN